MFLGSGGGEIVTETVAHSSVFGELGHAILGYISDVALIILPIVVIFILFQVFAFKFPKQKVVKMLYNKKSQLCVVGFFNYQKNFCI